MKNSFPERWVTYGLHHFRPVRGTYAEFDLDSCPETGHLTDDFAWITSPPDELDSDGMGIEHQTDDEFAAALDVLRASAPFGVPLSFWQFLGSARLRGCPLSPTDCHWELSPSWIVLPSLSGDRFARFMSDSQYCYSWYLRVTADAAVSVVACGGLGTEELEFESPLIEDAPYSAQPVVEQHVLDSLVTVAHSFHEFIYRIWIEGMIWFRIYRRLPLTTTELAYVEQISTNEAEQNAGGNGSQQSVA